MPQSQDLIDGILLANGIPRTGQFSAKAFNGVNDGLATKLLDLFARGRSTVAVTDKPGGRSDSDGVYSSKSDKVELAKTANTKVMAHEAVHAIESKNFVPAAEAILKDPNPSAQDKAFLDKYMAVISKYNNQLLEVKASPEFKKLSPELQADALKVFSPVERMGYITDGMTKDAKSANQILQEILGKNFGSDTGTLESLIDALPDKFKRTQNQVSKSY